MFYRMTRGSVSVIRSNQKDIERAQADGFEIVGPCDADGNLTGADLPEIEAPRPKGGKRGA